MISGCERKGLLLDEIVEIYLDCSGDRLIEKGE